MYLIRDICKGHDAHCMALRQAKHKSDGKQAKLNENNGEPTKRIVPTYTQAISYPERYKNASNVKKIKTKMGIEKTLACLE